MFTATSIRQSEIFAAISAQPGVTKRELMERFSIGRKALEMHLARLVDSRQVHSVAVAGSSSRGWHAGEARPSSARVASVFDLAASMALS